MSQPITEEDLIASIADALQFISYYHPADYIRHLAGAWAEEESPAARNAMAQILVNSRLAAYGRRPICQDTGVANVFMKIGMGARFATDRPLGELVDEGVRRPGRTRPIRCAPRWWRKRRRRRAPRCRSARHPRPA
ncbi:MAG: fumarate hydratase [Aliidongia sp.]